MIKILLLLISEDDDDDYADSYDNHAENKAWHEQHIRHVGA